MLDDSIKEVNFRASVKRFFRERLENAQHIPVSFDITTTSPAIQDSTLSKWVVVQFGSGDFSPLSRRVIQLFCCTRKDPEAVELAKISDLLVELLYDNTMTDKMRRIPFYRPADTLQAWTLIGALLVQDVSPGIDATAPDGTKYRMYNALLRWGTKV
jgi:hypothetical protein